MCLRLGEIEVACQLIDTASAAYPRLDPNWDSLVVSGLRPLSTPAMTTQARSASSDLAELDKLLNVDGLRLVDAGCGSMRFSRALANRGAQVLAIDPDPIQAKLNRDLPAEPNIEFVETGADALPSDDASVDGILFSYSLHHVPMDLYRKVFTEAVRVLKPDGFFCTMEPVAEGELNEVMSLFHDEKQVRADAQLALNTLGKTMFSETQVVEYFNVIQFRGWDEFADHYVKSSYNTNYSVEDVRDSKVEALFEQRGKPLGYRFECPMKITCLKNPA